MKIAVDHIKDKPLLVHVEEALETFPVLMEMQRDQACRFNGVVSGDLSAVREYDHIRVNGRVSVPVTLSCSRCLADYDTFVDTSFTLIFRKDSPTRHVDSDELELDEADLLSSTYQGDEIDLTHEIEEQVAMEIPLKPLCNDECKGLCQVCGVDLNQAGCSCSNQTANFRFSALKDFKVNG